MRKLLVAGVFLGLVLGNLRPAAAQLNPNAVVAGPVKKPRFYGFALDLSLTDYQNVNATQNYGNFPANNMQVFFNPRWAFGRMFLGSTPLKGMALQVRFSIDFGLNNQNNPAYFSGDLGPPKPCSDLQVQPNGTVDAAQVQRCPTPNPNRVNYGDLSLWLPLGAVYVIPKLKVAIIPRLQTDIPISAQSRSAGLQGTLGGALILSRAFFDGKLSFTYILSGTKNFHKYKQGGMPSEGQSGLPDGRITNNYLTSDAGTGLFFFDTSPGPALTDFSFGNALSIGYDPLPQLSFSVTYALRSGFGYELTNCSFTYDKQGQTTNPCANANTVAERSNGVGTAGRSHMDTQVFWVSAGYSPTDWFNLSLGVVSFAPLRRADNSYQPVFFDTSYNQYTSLMLSAGFTVDAAAAKIFKEKKAN